MHSFEFQLHTCAALRARALTSTDPLDDVFNAIAVATAVHQDSLALLISIYKRASILTRWNGDHLSYGVTRLNYTVT